MLRFLDPGALAAGGGVVFVSSLIAMAVGALIRPARADLAPPFETFVVPKPDAVAPAPAQTVAGSSQAATSSRSKPVSPKLAATGTMQIVMTLFPGGNSLASTIAGKFGGQEIDSSLQIRNGLGRDLLNLGYLESGHGASSVRIGGANAGILSGSEGIRFSSSTATPGLSTGYGFYRGMSHGNAWLPAFDAQWSRTKDTLFDGMVAADTSWKLTQATQAGSVHFASFAESDHATRESDVGYTASGNLSPSWSIYQSLTRSSKGGDQTSAYGATEKFGNDLFAIDDLQSKQSKFTFHERLLGLLLPLNRKWLNLRWQNSDLQVAKSGGIGHSETSLSASLMTEISSRTQVSLSATAFSRVSGSVRRSEYSVGMNHVFSPLWRIQATVAKEYARSTYDLRSTLEYRLSTEWQVRLLAGPSLSAASSAQKPLSWGLQIVRNLTVASQPEGSIQGTALLDGRACPFPLWIDLDGVCAAQTDRQGRFHLRHVMGGNHSVEIDLKNLPAIFSPQEPGLSVDVSSNKSAAVALHLATVGRIDGSIEVKADALGRRDLSAGIGVTVMDGKGQATTTDANGAFVLGNLPLGRYRISLAKETLPQGYQIDEPQSVDVVVGSDQRCAPIHFTVTPLHRAVVFDNVSP